MEIREKEYTGRFLGKILLLVSPERIVPFAVQTIEFWLKKTSKIKGVMVTRSKKCTNNTAVFKEIIIINETNNSAELYDFLQLIT